MANPNIVNVIDIRGNTSSFAITSNATPFATAVANNPAGSNKVYKINTKNNLLIQTLNSKTKKKDYPKKCYFPSLFGWL